MAEEEWEREILRRGQEEKYELSMCRMFVLVRHNANFNNQKCPTGLPAGHWLYGLLEHDVYSTVKSTTFGCFVCEFRFEFTFTNYFD